MLPLEEVHWQLREEGVGVGRFDDQAVRREWVVEPRLENKNHKFTRGNSYIYI